MPTSTLTVKGQITLPKEVREHFQLAVGDQVEFSIAGDGSVTVKPVRRRAAELYGFLRRDGLEGATVEGMDEAISEVVAEDSERVRRGS